MGRSDDLVTTDGMFFQSNTLGTTYGTVYQRLIDYDDQLNRQTHAGRELAVLAGRDAAAVQPPPGRQVA